VGLSDIVQASITGFTTQAVNTSIVQFTRNDAAAGVSAMLGLTALGSGAAGDGGSINFAGKSSTTAATAMAAIKWLWTDATNATRKAKLQLSAYDTAERIGIDILANGTTPDINIYGDTWFVGTGTGLPFGSCYGLEIAQTQASAAQNTWYVVNDTDMTDGELNLVTHDGSGKLTAAKAGKYLITYSFTFEANANNKHIRAAVAINGTAQNQGQSHTESITNQELVLAGNGIFTLAANDYVQLAFSTSDTGTPDITADDVIISIVQIGA
jgi:hypothetical protein